MDKNLKYISHLNRIQVFEHVMQSHELWGGGDPVDIRAQKLLNRLAWYPELIAMAGLVDESNNLVCSLKKYYTKVQIGEKIVSCIGFGAIFTNKNYRTKGYAEKLIRLVLNEATTEQNCEMALLFSDIGSKYYDRFGFVALPSQSWKKSFHPVSLNNVNFRRPKNENEAIEIYEKFTKNYSLRPKRVSAIWSFYRELNHVEEEWIVSINGKTSGFFSCSYGDGYLWIEEIFSGKENTEELWSAIHHFARAKNLPQLRGWFYNHYGKYAFQEIEERTRAVPMVLKLRDQSFDLENCYFGSPDHI